MQDALQIYVINLDRSPERWTDMQARLAGLPWPITRISALDARDNPEGVLAQRGQTLSMPPQGLGWNPLRERLYSLVEEACFSSHLLALQTFLGSGAPRALILEDDAVPQRDLTLQIEALLSCSDNDIIKLEGGNRRGGRPAIKERRCGAARIVRSLVPSSGSAAYLVTRDGARRMIENARQLKIPYDDYLSSRALHGAAIVHLSPWLFLQADTASTMVAARMPHRHVKRRDPYHFLAQGWRRGRLRVLLWRDAVLHPRLSFALTWARW